MCVTCLYPDLSKGYKQVTMAETSLTCSCTLYKWKQIGKKKLLMQQLEI